MHGWNSQPGAEARVLNGRTPEKGLFPLLLNSHENSSWFQLWRKNRSLGHRVEVHIFGCLKFFIPRTYSSMDPSQEMRKAVNIAQRTSSLNVSVPRPNCFCGIAHMKLCVGRRAAWSEPQSRIYTKAVFVAENAKRPRLMSPRKVLASYPKKGWWPSGASGPAQDRYQYTSRPLNSKSENPKQAENTQEICVGFLQDFELTGDGSCLHSDQAGPSCTCGVAPQHIGQRPWWTSISRDSGYQILTFCWRH